MKKSKKTLIITVSAVLLLLVIAIASFFGTGNQIISGMYLRSEYGTSVIVTDDGRRKVFYKADKDDFSEYNTGDRITVVCGKNVVLCGGLYGPGVECYFSFRTEKGSTDDVPDFFRDAGKNVLTGRYLSTDSDTHMLIDENGGATQLCDYEDYYMKYWGCCDGDKIMVVCNEIRETYPAQTDVRFCWIFERGSLDDIPDSTLENLRELGWIE